MECKSDCDLSGSDYARILNALSLSESSIHEGGHVCERLKRKLPHTCMTRWRIHGLMDIFEDRVLLELRNHKGQSCVLRVASGRARPNGIDGVLRLSKRLHGVVPPVKCHGVRTIRVEGEPDRFLYAIMMGRLGHGVKCNGLAFSGLAVSLFRKLRDRGVTYGGESLDQVYVSKSGLRLTDLSHVSEEYFPYVDVETFLYHMRPTMSDDVFESVVKKFNDFLGERATVERAAPLPPGVEMPLRGTADNLRVIREHYVRYS